MSFLLIFNIFSHLHFIVYTVDFEQVCKWGAATPTDSLIVNMNIFSGTITIEY